MVKADRENENLLWSVISQKLSKKEGSELARPGRIPLTNDDREVLKTGVYQCYPCENRWRKRGIKPNGKKGPTKWITKCKGCKKMVTPVEMENWTKRWFGYFRCIQEGCGRTWTSTYTWTIDNQIQDSKCKDCLVNVMPYKIREREKNEKEMDKLPVDMKKPHNQDLCSMCNKLGRKCTGIVEEDVSDDEKIKSNEPAHRVIRKDGFEFKVRGGIVGTPGRGGGRGGGFSGRGFGENGGFGGGYSGDGFDADQFRGDGAILFVGGLPYVSQEEVRNFLQEKIPNAQSARVPMEQYEIGKIRGFAYVQLRSDVDVTTVIDQVSNLKMGDRPLRIYESKSREGRRLFGGGGGFGDGNHVDDFGIGNAELGFDGNRRSNRAGGTLYVGGIPLGTSEVEVRDFLDNKIPNVDYVRVPIDRETNEIKGIAFVELLMHANITNVAMRIQGLKMNGKILTIKDAKPKREEILTRDLSQNRRGYYRGRCSRGGLLNRRGFGCGRYTGSSGFEDVQTRSFHGAFLVVHGLPLMKRSRGICREDFEDYLLDVIPHAEDVRIVTKMGGNGFFEPRAWVRLKAGIHADNVIRQVDGLCINGRNLQIEESMITWDVFESIGGMSDDEDCTGYLVIDSSESDDSTENLGVVFSGLGVGDRQSTNVRKPARSTRINSVSSARSLRSNSGSGFVRDTNGNFVGDRIGNGNDDSSSNASDYEPDMDPERYHW